MGGAITYSTGINTSFHLHIALLSPVLSPRVLCSPNFLPLFLSITNYKHGVIRLLGTFITSRVLVHSTVVILKPLGHNKGNSYRTL